MKAFAASVLVSATPLALWGCGGDDTTVAPTAAPTAAPTPGYNPTDVQTAWNNHFGAFATFNVDDIMKDYDNNSAIHVYNDHCFPPSGADFQSPRGLTRYEGTARIREFFEALFAQLNNTLSNVDHVGPNGAENVPATESGGSPVVKERTGNMDATANVFLTWRTPSTMPNQIEFATDSFSWRFISGRFWIDLQTIVVTETATCTSATRATVPANTTDLSRAWSNHFDAFGARDNVSIMADYSPSSIVQLFDNRNLKYDIYTGIDEIQTMFTELFAAMAAASSGSGDNPEGLEVSLLEIEERFNSVFLAWKSNSHDKATDTFIFSGDKIIRQNIVVTTKSRMKSEQVIGVIV